MSCLRCLWEGACLVCVVCVCLRVVVFSAYCGVVLFCFSSSFCVPSVACFSGLSLFDCPFGILYNLFTKAERFGP